MKTILIATMVLTGVGAGTPASAAAGSDAAPRVYTNEDLDRLGPPPASPSRPVSGADDPGWDYVQRFIDAENARIVTDRTLDMEERRRAIEDDALQSYNDRRNFVGRAYGDWNAGWPGSYLGMPYGYGGRAFYGVRGGGWRHNRNPGAGGPSMGRPGAPKAGGHRAGPATVRNARPRAR